MTRYTPLWLQAGSYAASVDRRLLGALWPAPASSGCAVTLNSGMVVNIAPGQVAVPSQNNTGTTLCSSDAIEQVTITAAPGSGLNRIDLIICRPRGNDLDGGSNTDFIFDYVTGTAAASPAVPATPAGTVALAQILVVGGSAAISPANITDVRPAGLAIGGAGALPPPVTSGSTVQSFTDANGEVWVAKNGVNGGAWRKARDVLFAKASRVAAYTLSTTATAFPWDTAAADNYGLLTLGANGGYRAPVAGIYLLNAFVHINGATRGYGYHLINGTTQSLADETTPGTGGYSAIRYNTAVRAAAGDLLSVAAAVGSAMAIFPNGDCWMTTVYQGTG